jgi:hypothetical protein
MILKVVAVAGDFPRSARRQRGAGSRRRRADWVSITSSTTLYHPEMNSGPRNVAQIRHDNALLLFDEFVHATVKHADAATLRGLEGRFAERLQIQPSYWSQIKGRSRQIGERLARQFEQLCRKPLGWMDQLHIDTGWSGAAHSPTANAPPFAATSDDAQRNVPQDDDERFIVGLVLSYYRRHPQRARARLLDLLGEVLTPAPASVAKPAPPKPAGPPDDGRDLWSKTQAAVKPLKPKR